MQNDENKTVDAATFRVHVAEFPSATDSTPTRCSEMTLQQLGDLLSSTGGRSISRRFDPKLGEEVVPKKELQGFVPVQLCPDGKRRAEHVVSVSALVLDVDNATPIGTGSGPLTIAEFKRRVHAELPEIVPLAWVYTTVSHTDAVPKFRVVFPLAEPAEPSIWGDVVSWAHGHLGLRPVLAALDAATNNAAQLWFKPTQVDGDPPPLFDSFGSSLLAPPLGRLRARAQQDREDESELGLPHGGDSGYDRRAEILIKSKLDLVEVVEKYGYALERRGRNMVGLCPFHPDKGTPNFYVHIEKQYFKCFNPVCPGARGGDVFEFVERITRQSHRVVLEILAVATGVDLEKYRSNIYQFPKMAGLSAPSDSALPDSALPDSALPDSALPDSALPDSALPDSALPDSALPGSALPDSATPQGSESDAQQHSVRGLQTRDEMAASSSPTPPRVENLQRPMAASSEPPRRSGGFNLPPLSDSISEFAKTDDERARLFSEYAMDRLRFCGDEDAWYRWTGRFWERSGALATQMPYEILTEYSEVLRAAYEREALPERKKLRYALVNLTMNDAPRKSMLNIAKVKLNIRVDAFNTNPGLLNARNGTINLETGALRPHRREDFMSKLIDTAYDPSALCPKWESFMEAVQPDAATRAYLKRAFGYAITGHTKEHVMFYFHGNGSNGKSTMVETIGAVLGAKYAGNQDRGYALTLRPEQLAEQDRNNGSSPTPEIAQLKGMRFVVSSEPDYKFKLSPRIIKSLVSSDRVSARRLYSAPMSFIPEFKLFLSANDRLTIPGTDAGIWRRVLLIPFGESFSENCRKRDRNLAKKFEAEFDGILRWLVEGSADWHASGEELGTCPVVQTATSEYRREMDKVGQFLDEYCKIDTADSKAVTGARTLLEAFNHWLFTEQAEKNMWAKQRFTADLVKRGVEHFRTNKGMAYRYVTLLATPENHYSRLGAV